MAPKAHGSTKQSVQQVLRFGADRNVADNICSFNRHYAEPSGSYHSDTTFIQEVSDAVGPLVFYDSVTGEPLFVAPAGSRSKEAFLQESYAHGWPSFRCDEVVWDNVRILPDGEVVSVAGTHLGHNIPDDEGHRFCINLVSISGMPRATSWTQDTFREALRGGGAGLSRPARAPPPQLNFFANLLKEQPSPADDYRPDLSARTAGFPKNYEALHSAAIAGAKAALTAGLATAEIDFPPITNVNARGDGSAKSERLVDEANANFVRKLSAALGASNLVVGCSRGALAALGGASVSLRDAKPMAGDYDVAIVVSPSTDEQWDAAVALGVRILVVNGLLQNGRCPHAYFYKPMTAFSVQTGGVVRQFPGAYEVFDVRGRKLDLEITLAKQGKRALPDTKVAQMRLQSEYGSTQSS